MLVKDDGGEHQRHRQSIQTAVQAAFVSAAQPVKLPIDEQRQPRLPAAALRIGSLEQPRAQHRRQGQRDDARYGDGANEREGELRKQRAGQPALEADRHITAASTTSWR